MNNKNNSNGFTIVELIITIVIISILSVIALTSYYGITTKAIDSSIASDASNMDTKQKVHIVENDSAKVYYSGQNGEPDTTLGYKPSSGNVVDVVINGNEYCIRVYNPSETYNSIDNAYTIESSSGICSTPPTDEQP